MIHTGDNMIRIEVCFEGVRYIAEARLSYAAGGWHAWLREDDMFGPIIQRRNVSETMPDVRATLWDMIDSELARVQS